eukprot:1151939-Pelagomonas_calceolata.AAC.1
MLYYSLVKAGGQFVDLQASCGCLAEQECMGDIANITLLRLTFQCNEYANGCVIKSVASLTEGIAHDFESVPDTHDVGHQGCRGIGAACLPKFVFTDQVSLHYGWKWMGKLKRSRLVLLFGVGARPFWEGPRVLPKFDLTPTSFFVSRLAGEKRFAGISPPPINYNLILSGRVRAATSSCSLESLLTDSLTLKGGIVPRSASLQAGQAALTAQRDQGKQPQPKGAGSSHDSGAAKESSRSLGCLSGKGKTCGQCGADTHVQGAGFKREAAHMREFQVISSGRMPAGYRKATGRRWGAMGCCGGWQRLKVMQARKLWVSMLSVQY